MNARTEGALEQRVGELDLAARLVGQLYAIASPRVFSVALTRQLLAGADFRVSGRRLSAGDIIDATAELLDAGIVSRVVGGAAVGIARDCALPLVRMAHREGNLWRLFKVIDQGLSYYNYSDRWERSIRAHLVAGNAAEVAKLVKPYPPEGGFWSFLADPWADDLVALLPPEHRPAAIHQGLRHVIETAAPPEPVLATAMASLEGRRRHAAAAAFVRVLQGRFDAAEAVFADLPADVRDEKPIAVARAATRALVAALRGNYDDARRLIDEAIALEKAGTRKRAVFPNFRAFAFSLLAIAVEGSADSHARLSQLLRTAQRLDAGWPRETEFVEALAQAKAGYRLQFDFADVEPTLPLLLQALGGCWAEEFPSDWPIAEEVLVRYQDRARANGFAWIVAECEEVALRSLGAKPSPDATGHAALGTVTLASLAEPLPDWEFALKGFEQLAFETKSKTAPKKAKPKAAGALRLVWDLVDDGFAILPEPREQRVLKNGKWSKGRQVSLHRLASDAAKMAHLRPEDREAAASLQSASRRGGARTWATMKTTYSLAGHPHVYNGRGESVDVVRREPELSIQNTDDGGIRLTLQPVEEDYEDYVGEHPRYLARMVADRRCEVTHYAPSHLGLLALVGCGGLELPADARSRALEAAAVLAADVRVHGGDAEDTAAAVAVEPDSEPWVRLEPFETGLSVAIVVEPIPDSGISFSPGSGAVTVFAHRDGESLQTRRDFAAERAAVQSLASKHPALASEPTELAPLLLPDPEDCLELIDSLNGGLNAGLNPGLNAGVNAGLNPGLNAEKVRCKWPKGEPFRVVGRASAPSLQVTVRSADQWLEASGRLAVDKTKVLDFKQLFALLDAHPGSRFVELAHGQFLALTRNFRRQLDDLASIGAASAGGGVRLHQLAAMAVDDLLNDADVDADEAFRERVATVAAPVEVDVPSTLRAELRPYQEEGFRWLARLAHWGAGACLADDMGLGKTVQALALLLHRAPDGPGLVVAPTSVAANWLDEARRFAPTLNVKLYVGPVESRAALLESAKPFDLYVTTYGLMQNDIQALAEVRWRSAVLDEAQAIKNPGTKRAQAARRLRADFRLVTTGTPVQNNLMDLHSLFGFLNPGLLGAAQHFQRAFAAAVEAGDREANARLRRLVAPFLLRRLKTEVLDDLPERTEITLHVRMSPEEAALYEALRERAVADLESARAGDAPRAGHAPLPEGARRVQLLAHLTRLRLACCNPRLAAPDWDAGKAPPSSKMQTFADTLAELIENNHKVLVFSQFVKHLKLVEEYVAGAGISYQYLDGATPAAARRERIAAFQAGQGDVFLISLKAGGTGLNLTAADYVIHLDPWWNPAVEDQASDRAHRIGQQRPVTIYRLVAEGTIEEQVVELHRHKRELAQRLLEGSDSAARLSADELLSLLRQPLTGMGEADAA